MVQYRKLKDSVRTYRDGVRDAGFMLDVELTTTGFAGTENTDWENVEKTEVVSDYDGNVYTTVTIGTQQWMVENLKTTHYQDGTDITNVTDNAAWIALSTEAYSWHTNDIGNIYYGALYNWWAVNDAHNICPDGGWRVPTETDLDTLMTFLGGIGLAGGAMKQTGVVYWDAPNTGATNSSGFTMPGSAFRDETAGNFYDLGAFGFLWSATGSGANAYAYGLDSTNDNVVKNLYDKNVGFSVRLVRDLS
jgi:uncharacterized protein (TIGR02145 family)